MLSNTLILPESDAQLAGQLLRGAIDDLNVVLMLVIGKDDIGTLSIEKIVEWADTLCNKAQVVATNNRRHVVWIRKPDVQPVKDVLDPILGSERPLIVVLNFYDVVKGKLLATDKITPLTMDLQFAKGYHS